MYEAVSYWCVSNLGCDGMLSFVYVSAYIRLICLLNVK